jgi:hemolysin activation/secretion protein
MSACPDLARSAGHRPAPRPHQPRWAQVAGAGVALLVASAPWTAASAQDIPSAAAVADAGPLVEVRRYEVGGNTLLSPAQIQAALAAHTGPRSLAGLRAAAQAVQALYGQAGYAAVVVYLPPQPAADGVVTLNVVEGKLARVDVQGAQRLGAERVRAALPSLVEGRTPRVRQIDAELQIANENPGRSMGVLLGPGTNPGEVVATVQVTEQPLQRFTLSLDNTGNARTGRYRLGLGWQHADLTGHDDLLGVQLQTSPTDPGSVRVVSAAWRWPLVLQRAALDVFAAYSDVDGGLQSTLAGDLRFAGSGRVVGARVVWYLPRWGEFDQRLTTGLERRDYRNDCSVTGLPDGACGAAGESVGVQPLTLEYAAQAAGAVPALFNLALVHNLALGGRHGSAADFDAVREGAPRRYTVLRAGGSVATTVLDGLQLSGRLALQHGDDRLVPGEQFGVGGANSVRGYAERELAGDTGVLLSVELASGRLGEGLVPAGTDLRALVFADAGQVRSLGGIDCRPGRRTCTAASVGLGARLAWGPVQWRFFAAQALRDGADTRRHGWRSHAALVASF